MSPEKLQTLCEKYPDFFAGVHEPITRNLMPFGCECGDGWYNIIDTFCRLAKSYLAQNKNPYTFKFVQIKEKFGGLRLYYDFSYPSDPARERELQSLLQGLASFAEDLSYQTCELTGMPGKLYQTGWHKTLCDEEAKKRGYIK